METEYTELQLRRIRSSCSCCQETAGGTAACSCHVFCGDVLCQHHPELFVDEFVAPKVPVFDLRRPA